MSESDKIKTTLLAQKLTEAQEALVNLGPKFNDGLTLIALQAFLKIKDLESSQVLQYFLKNGLTEKDYAKFVNLERKDDPNQIPDVLIKGEEIGRPGLYLMKVNVMDDMQAARAACLGQLTNCCQSLSGEAGEPCAIHGLTSPNGGFYVVCQGDVNHPKIEDKLIGQCWAWRSQSGAMVFDSIEVVKQIKYNDASKKQVVDFYHYLAEKLVLEKGIAKVACGAKSGISSNLGLEVCFYEDEYPIDYSNYRDSYQQKLIYDALHPYYTYSLHKSCQDFTNNIISEAINSDKALAEVKQFVELLNYVFIQDLPLIKTKINSLLTNKNKDDDFKKLVDLIQKYIMIDKDKIISTEEQEFLLNEMKGLNLIDKVGVSYLIWVVKNGHADICEKLIESGTDINKSNNNGLTALMLAAEAGHADICQKLIAKGANINIKNDHGETALMLAAMAGHAGVFEKLIKGVEDINITNNRGETALMLAVKAGHIAFFEKLIEAGADIYIKDSCGNTALIFSAEGGYSNIFEKLIESSEDINITNNHGDTALMLAAKAGHADVCEKLINGVKDINIINNRGETALMFAAKAGHIAILKKLIEAGADINIKDNQGNTALIFSAEAGHSAICEELIAKEVDIHAKGSYGNTALILAAKKGLADICVKLIKQGADITVANQFHQTTLFFSVAMGLKDICEKLIEKGADLNAGKGDQTPLGIAVRRGNADICEILIKKGADIHGKYPQFDLLQGGEQEVTIFDLAPDNFKKKLEKMIKELSPQKNSSVMTPLYELHTDKSEGMNTTKIPAHSAGEPLPENDTIKEAPNKLR